MLKVALESDKLDRVTCPPVNIQLLNDVNENVRF